MDHQALVHDSNPCICLYTYAIVYRYIEFYLRILTVRKGKERKPKMQGVYCHGSV